MKSTIEFAPQYVGRLAAFWDTDQRNRRGSSLYDPAAQISEEALFPADYTEQQAIDECWEISDCFGDHVCICRIRGNSMLHQIARLDFDTE